MEKAREIMLHQLMVLKNEWKRHRAIALKEGQSTTVKLLDDNIARLEALIKSLDGVK